MFDDDHAGEYHDDDLMEWLPLDRTARYRKLKALRDVYKSWGGEWRWAVETIRQRLTALEQEDREAWQDWLRCLSADDIRAWRERAG